MTEDDAKGWMVDRFGTGAADQIAIFLDRVVAENQHHNLISPGTIDTIWARHAVDSAQLLALAPAGWSTWLDIGTGGGFPGMIVALLGAGAVTMVEPRRRRAEFLQSCVDDFALANGKVVQGKVESIEQAARVISARAVASVEKLLRAAGGCATAETTWLLPRGRATDQDRAFLSSLRRSMFHVEHSITDPASEILVVQGTGR